MKPLDARQIGGMHSGAPSFSLANRLWRAGWIVGWCLLARWTPPPLHGWRRFVLRAFGARLGKGVRVYGSVRIWDPRNLVMEDDSWLGPRVNCYDQGLITIGQQTIVSQGAHLCAGTHDISDPAFQLLALPITIGGDVWIATEAFVGPGVRVGDGAVLGARAVAMRSLEPWTIYTGNPAAALRRRSFARHANP